MTTLPFEVAKNVLAIWLTGVRQVVLHPNIALGAIIALVFVAVFF